jgi:hypothetical protein
MKKKPFSPSYSTLGGPHYGRSLSWGLTPLWVGPLWEVPLMGSYSTLGGPIMGGPSQGSDSTMGGPTLGGPSQGSYSTLGGPTLGGPSQGSDSTMPTKITPKNKEWSRTPERFISQILSTFFGIKSQILGQKNF